MRWCATAILLEIALGCGGGSAPVPRSAAGLPLWDLRIGEHALRVEVASSDEERVMGYRFRERVPDGTGMLFLFPAPRFLRFVMSGVTVPLSIAFIDDGGRICQICDMQLSPTETTASAFKVRYALEVPLGWFARNGIGEDAVVEGIAEAAARLPAK